MEKIDLRQKLAQFQDYWNPRVIADVNETQVKLAKLKGEFDWHQHEHEDELFLVIQGRLLMQFRERDVWLEEGEMIVVPHGVEHRPVAPEEVHVMLVEPASTLNTGNVRTPRTRDRLERL